MNQSKGPGPGAGLAFFGAITAAMSHELMNVLAIVNEYGGLLEDMAAAAEKGGAIKPERLSSLGSKIGANVERGRVLIKRLNRFAHLVDDPNVTFNAGEAVNAIVELAGRFAQLRKIRLACRTSSEIVILTGDPFAFQHAVFLAMRIAMAGLTESQSLAVSVDPEGSGCRVGVEIEQALSRTEETEPDRNQLALLMSVPGARLVERPQSLELYFA